MKKEKKRKNIIIFLKCPLLLIRNGTTLNNSLVCILEKGEGNIEIKFTIGKFHIFWDNPKYYHILWRGGSTLFLFLFLDYTILMISSQPNLLEKNEIRLQLSEGFISRRDHVNHITFLE